MALGGDLRYAYGSIDDDACDEYLVPTVSHSLHGSRVWSCGRAACGSVGPWAWLSVQHVWGLLRWCEGF
eukprot:6136281-Prymnesium_polylepis.1